MSTEIGKQKTTDRDAGDSSHGLWLCALLVFAVGTAMTLYTWNATRKLQPILQSKAAYLDRLNAIQSELARGADAVAIFQKAADARPMPLPEIMKEIPGGLKAEEIKDVKRDTVPGWVVRQKDITFNDAMIDKVMAFVAKAESLRPPWILTKCVVRASSRTAGIAKIELTMEAVEKAP